MSACNLPLDVRLSVDCIVMTDQSFHPDTKAWLASHADDAPPSADGDFKRVADNTEKFNTYCRDAGPIGATP